MALGSNTPVLTMLAAHSRQKRAVSTVTEFATRKSCARQSGKRDLEDDLYSRRETEAENPLFPLIDLQKSHKQPRALINFQLECLTSDLFYSRALGPR